MAAATAVRVAQVGCFGYSAPLTLAFLLLLLYSPQAAQVNSLKRRTAAPASQHHRVNKPVGRSYGTITKPRQQWLSFVAHDSFGP